MTVGVGLQPVSADRALSVSLPESVASPVADATTAFGAATCEVPCPPRPLMQSSPGGNPHLDPASCHIGSRDETPQPGNDHRQAATEQGAKFPPRCMSLCLHDRAHCHRQMIAPEWRFQRDQGCGASRMTRARRTRYVGFGQPGEGSCCPVWLFRLDKPGRALPTVGVYPSASPPRLSSPMPRPTRRSSTPDRCYPASNRG
jgi:hypothetical protein